MRDKQFDYKGESVKINLSKFLIFFLRLSERLADAIILSTDETDKKTLEAYQKGKADLARMQNELEKD